MSLVPESIERPYGRLFVLREEAVRFPARPLVLLLHGAFEKHKKLLPWSELWRAEYDVALADLPGHGQSDSLGTVTFDAYVDELRWLVGEYFARRRVAIVGDSFGGLLGVALGNEPPANLAAAVALDPLLATAKQWSIRDLVPRILEGQAEGSFRRSFTANILGMGEGAPQDRRYHHFVEGVRVPALVLAGAEPLGVRREVAGPSLLDQDDRAFVQKHVDLSIIAGVGHQLVLQRPSEAFAVAEGFVRSLP